MAVLSQSQ